MNEPIISPWLIYWAGRIDMIQGICLIVGIIVTIYAVIATLAVITGDNKDKEFVKVVKIIVCTKNESKAPGSRQKMAEKS